MPAHKPYTPRTTPDVFKGLANKFKEYMDMFKKYKEAIEKYQEEERNRRRLEESYAGYNAALDNLIGGM